VSLIAAPQAGMSKIDDSPRSPMCERGGVIRRASVSTLLVAVLALTACGNDSSDSALEGKDFCETAREFDKRFDRALSEVGSVGEDTEEWLESASDALAALRNQAPSEIRTDMETLSTALDELIDVLEDADFDITKLTADQGEALRDPKFARSSEKVSQYLEDECRIDVSE
jgi:hypothetical protein